MARWLFHHRQASIEHGEDDVSINALVAVQRVLEELGVEFLQAVMLENERWWAHGGCRSTKAPETMPDKASRRSTDAAGAIYSSYNYCEGNNGE
ncbi:hypothetical protein IQ288_31325 [Burkholderia sp. R-69980]|nr:hypothetical protein [Burkholderia sp. R-69980]